MCTTEGTCATRANLTPLPRYFWKPFLSWVCVTNTSVYLAGDIQLRLLTNQAAVCLQLFSLGKSFWDWLYSSLYFELEYLQESRWWACPWEKGTPCCHLRGGSCWWDSRIASPSCVVYVSSSFEYRMNRAAGAAISDMDSQRGPAACPSPFCSAGKLGDTSPLHELQPARLLRAAQERRARDSLK